MINKRNYGIYRFNYTLSCKSKEYNGELLEEQLEYKEFNSKLYLNYHLLKNYFEYKAASTFKIHKITLDNAKNCVHVKFTQPIHPRRWKEAEINLIVNGKIIRDIKVNPLYDELEIYYPADNKQMQTINQENADQITVNIVNLVSIYKMPLDFGPPSGLFQYREFFTNEIKTGNLIPDSAFASKLVPLYQVDQKIDAEFWNTYNTFLRQPLKE
ncbi:MAG: hypothetical protein HC905_10355 [Bacteroidales bacterium]|nr:hypothetical protein [Bacteroidales bacterium]